MNRPHRFLLLLLFFSILLAHPGETSTSGVREPYGFRDIPWSADLSTAPFMRHIRNAEVAYEGWTTYWSRINEKKKLGPVDCREIEYKAFGAYFYAVTIKFDEDDCFLVADIFSQAHGKEPVFKTPLEEDWFEGIVRYQWYWDFEKSYIRLTSVIADSGDFGFAEIVNKDLEEKSHMYMDTVLREKRKMDVEEGVVDLFK